MRGVDLAIIVVSLTGLACDSDTRTGAPRDASTAHPDASAAAPDAGPKPDAGRAGAPDAGDEADAGVQGHPIWSEVTPAGSDTVIEGDESNLDYDYSLPSRDEEARVFTSMALPADIAWVRYRTTADRLVAYIDDTTVVLHEADAPGDGAEITGEVLLDLAVGDALGFVLGGGLEAEDGTVQGRLSVQIMLWAPQIEPFTVNPRYVEADGALPIGDGTVQTFHLHVQRVRKVDGAWTNEPLVYDDGRLPRDVLFDSAALWVELYRDLIARGVAESEIRKLAQGIQSDQRDSGAYVETNLSACGYNGGARTITCGSGHSAYTKGTMLHESVHGWEWLTFEGDHALSILFRDAFTRFANLVYHTRATEPEKLRGEGWRLDYLNYGLQNSIEWGSEMFRDWVYGTASGGWPGNWQFASRHAPDFAAFFDCLWGEGAELFDCKQRAFGDGPLIERPELRPEDTSISVVGFTAADSEAIWKVCRGTEDAAAYTDRFDAIVRRVAPDLPDSPAAAYQLAVGDCNHDGVEDWLCWYTGRGPVGLGNGSYLWNSENTEGAYTFVVSGKIGDDYAEYLQDPFLVLPSINGSLAQPMFREWQGQYGSCNGALRIPPMGADWRRAYFGALLEP